MSSYNSHQPKWHAYHQNQLENGQQGGFQGHSGTRTQGSGKNTQSQGDMFGLEPAYSHPVKSAARQGLEGARDYTYSSHPAGSYHGASPDMQYMMQMMINLEDQLDQLNQLIAQNNQLMQSMHNQEDTKCIQGSGGGAIIVRM